MGPRFTFDNSFEDQLRKEIQEGKDAYWHRMWAGFSLAGNEANLTANGWDCEKLVRTSIKRADAMQKAYKERENENN